MTTATEQEHPDNPQALDAQLKDLEAELDEVRRELVVKRGRNAAVQLAAFFAVLLGLAALLAVAFKLDDDQSAGTAMHNQMRGNMPAAMNGGAVGGASTNASAATVNRVTADLGDYWVRPNVSSAPAGKVTFTAKNVGQVPHELMVERMPIKMDAPGRPNEEAAKGMIEDLEPGQSGHMTLNLTPGEYALFCNLPGHYAMGQHTTFKVTG